MESGAKNSVAKNKEKLSPILLYSTALIPQFTLLDQKLIGK
jgi:hypothetical protein